MTINQEVELINNYKVEGLENSDSSPLICLIHGAGGDFNHFHIVTPILVAHGFRVLLVDIRYHGLSQPLHPPVEKDITFKFTDVIQDIHTVLKQVKQNHYLHTHHPVPLFVGGLSMGGMITLLFAEDANNNETLKDHGFVLKGLVVMGSGVPHLEMEKPGWDVYRERKATPEILEFTRSSIIASALTESGKQETERAMKLISNTALYECLVEVASYFPVPSDPPNPYIPATRLPILLIWPDHDAYTKAEMEELQAANVKLGINSKLIVVADSGHMVALDKGKVVAHHIIEFLKDII